MAEEPLWLQIPLQVAGPLIAMAALYVSITGTRKAVGLANLALVKADKDEKYELSALIAKTKKLHQSVKFLDDYMFGNPSWFTRRPSILDALAEIQRYWLDHGGALAHFIGKDERAYLSFRGLYELALQNQDNQPPPNGVGTWRGMGQNLYGHTVEQITRYAWEALELKERGPFNGGPKPLV